MSEAKNIFKLSEQTWVPISIVIFIIGVVITFTLAAAAEINKVDKVAEKVTALEDEHTDFKESQIKTNEAIIGINSKLEILVPGYKK